MNLHYNSIVIDGHNDTTMAVVNEDTWLPENNMGNDTENQIDLNKLEKGGLDAAMFAAYTPGYYNNSARSLSRLLALINALYWTEEKNKDKLKIVNDSKEIIQIFKERIAAIPTIEGAYAIDKDNYLELLRQFRDLGVKLIGFNWNYSNNLGEGCKEVYSDGETKSKGGLTNLGAKTLEEMRKLGIGIDVSHMNEETFWGVVDNVDNPIIATHNGVYKIREHIRNLKDNQLKAIKDSSGIVGVVFYPSFITDNDEANIDDIVNHIDYIVNLVGIDHVGLGSDFDGATLPEDMKDASDTYKITEKLIERGYSDVDIKKILGENYLRVFKELEIKREKLEKLNLEIETNYKMGSILKDNYKLEISLIGKEEGLDCRFILDGKEIKVFEIENENLKFNLNFPNEEKFHVFTVEVGDKAGRLMRDTKIIYREQ